MTQQAYNTRYLSDQIAKARFVKAWMMAPPSPFSDDEDDFIAFVRLPDGLDA